MRAPAVMAQSDREQDILFSGIDDGWRVVPELLLELVAHVLVPHDPVGGAAGRHRHVHAAVVVDVGDVEVPRPFHGEVQREIQPAPAIR